MSNIIKIKSGDSPPTSENLDISELGYAKSNKGLYIKDNNGEVIHLNDSISYENIFNLLYPINSIYFTADKTFNPNETTNWYGVWEKISGYYLYLDDENTGDFAGDIENPFSVEIQDHILDETTMPPHTHNLNNISIDRASAGTHSASVSGNIGGSSSASHSHSLSGTATSGGRHRHGMPEVITTSSSSNARASAGTNRYWTNSSSLSTDYDGSHTHTLSGTANSTSVTIYGSDFDLNASFSGNTLPEHTHTASGSVDSSGEGNAISHEVVSELNIPRFNIICWKRVS